MLCPATTQTWKRDILSAVCEEFVFRRQWVGKKDFQTLLCKGIERNTFICIPITVTITFFVWQTVTDDFKCGRIKREEMGFVSRQFISDLNLPTLSAEQYICREVLQRFRDDPEVWNTVMVMESFGVCTDFGDRFVWPRKSPSLL